eukprot:scaffold502_cov350-Pavlova_lutheri.AAC.16
MELSGVFQDVVSFPHGGHAGVHVGHVRCHLHHVVTIQPSDGTDGHVHPLLPGSFDHVGRHHLGLGFGGRGEEGSEGHVICPLFHGCLGTFDVSVARGTDDLSRSHDVPGLSDRTIVLSDVHAVCVRPSCQFGTIVDEEERSVLLADLRQLSAHVHGFFVRVSFVSVLHHFRTS